MYFTSTLPLFQNVASKWQVDLEVICDMPLANQNEVSMLKVALVDEQSNRLLVNETIEAMIEPMGDGNYIEIFYTL